MIVDADEHSGVALPKETARGRQLGGLEALLAERFLQAGRICILHDGKYQFHTANMVAEAADLR